MQIRRLIQAARKVIPAPARFLGSWRALVCGEVIRAGAAGCRYLVEDRGNIRTFVDEIKPFVLVGVGGGFLID